jgi:hypothetical protein
MPSGGRRLEDLKGHVAWCKVVSWGCQGKGVRRGCPYHGVTRHNSPANPFICTDQCVNCRFGLPCVNAGELLHSEVQRRTPVGLEAERFMHGSRTVPDRWVPV